MSRSPGDIVIVAAYRTAICKARRGSFKDTYVEELLAGVISGTMKRAKIDPAWVGDIVVGTVLGQNVQRANEVRMAQFLAGIPHDVPIHTVNRQCSSGLQAVAECAAAIKAGFYELGLACGVESMSSAEFKFTGSTNPRVFVNSQAKACMLPMGITSENVATQFGISRAQQDKLAAESHSKAAKAIKSGRFKDEIIPIETTIKDPKTGESKKIVVEIDDGVRADTTVQGLAKLAPAFATGGTTTAGNSSQVSDGAACVVVTSRKFAQAHGLPILGIFRSFAATGVPPEVMGIGPVFAIPAALKQAGLTVNDIDLFEVNEAFASQATYCVEKLGIPMSKLNVNGGAIAIGHPLGATGARATATLLHEMHKRKSKYGVVSMCIGSGMGAAAVYERED